MADDLLDALDRLDEVDRRTSAPPASGDVSSSVVPGYAPNRGLGEVMNRLDAIDGEPTAILAEGTRQRLPWADVEAKLKKVGANADAVKQDYQLHEQRLAQEDQGIGVGEAFKRNSLPFGSFFDVKGQEAYGQAMERYRNKQATPEDLQRIARFDRLQEIDQDMGKTFAGKLVQATAGVSKIVGEFGVAGKAVGLGSRALGIGRAVEATAPAAAGAIAVPGQAILRSAPTTVLGSRAAGAVADHAGRMAATLPLVPSMYLEQARSRNLEEGRQANDIRGFPTAVGLGYVNALILGSLQPIAQGIPGGLAARAAGAGAIGVGEQAAGDVVGGIADEFLNHAYRTDTRFGVIGDLARGEAGEALKNATVEGMTFALFGAMHDRGPKPKPGTIRDTPIYDPKISAEENLKIVNKRNRPATMQPFADALASLVGKGFSKEAAATQLDFVHNQFANLIQQNPNANRVQGRAVAEKFRDPALREYASAVAETLPPAQLGPAKGVLTENMEYLAKLPKDEIANFAPGELRPEEIEHLKAAEKEGLLKMTADKDGGLDVDVTAEGEKVRGFFEGRSAGKSARPAAVGPVAQSKSSRPGSETETATFDNPSQETVKRYVADGYEMKTLPDGLTQFSRTRKPPESPRIDERGGEGKTPAPPLDRGQEVAKTGVPGRPEEAPTHLPAVEAEKVPTEGLRTDLNQDGKVVTEGIRPGVTEKPAEPAESKLPAGTIDAKSESSAPPKKSLRDVARSKGVRPDAAKMAELRKRAEAAAEEAEAKVTEGQAPDVETARAVRQAVTPEEVFNAAGLSERERHVITRLAENATYSEIAADPEMAKSDGMAMTKARVEQIAKKAQERLGLKNSIVKTAPSTEVTEAAERRAALVERGQRTTAEEFGKSAKELSRGKKRSKLSREDMEDAEQDRILAELEKAKAAHSTEGKEVDDATKQTQAQGREDGLSDATVRSDIAKVAAEAREAVRESLSGGDVAPAGEPGEAGKVASGERGGDTGDGLTPMYGGFPIPQKLIDGISRLIFGNKRAGDPTNFALDPDTNPNNQRLLPQWGFGKKASANQLGARNSSLADVASTAYSWFRSVVEANANEWLIGQGRRGDPFKVEKDGTFRLANDQRGYLEDVMKAEMQKPGSQPLTPEQRAAAEVWRGVWKKRLEEMKAAGVREFRDEAGDVLEVEDLLKEGYFPRPAIEKTAWGQAWENFLNSGNKGGNSASGGKLGQGPFYRSHRRRETEAEGVAAGVKYKTDWRERVNDFLKSSGNEIAGTHWMKDIDSGVPAEAKKQFKGMLARNRDVLAELPKEQRDKFVGSLKAQAQERASSLLFPSQEVGPYMKLVQEGFNELRGIILGPDFSPWTMQLAAMAWNPIRMGRTIARGMIEFIKPGVMARLAERPEYREAMQQIVQLGGTLGTPPEQVSGLVGKKSVVSRIPLGIGKTYERFAQTFSTLMDLAKVELWMANRGEDQTQWARSLEAIENSLGQGRMSQLGMTPERAFVERISMLAPSFVRGYVKLVQQAFQSGKPGLIAKKQLGALASAAFGVGFAGVIAARQLGVISDEEMDERLDPSRGKFLTIPVNVGDGKRVEVGMGGFYMSIARMMGNFDAWRKGEKSENPFIRWYQGHAGIAPKMFLETITGEDYFGRKTTTGDMIFRNTTPLVAQDTLPAIKRAVTGEPTGDQGTLRQNLGKGLAGFVGLRSFPESEGAAYTERLRQMAVKEHGKNYSSLTFEQQALLLKKLNDQGGGKPKMEQSPEAAYGAAQAESLRQAKINDLVGRPTQDRLKEFGHKLPGYDNTITLGKQQVPLTAQQQKQYQALLVEEYRNVVGKWDMKQLRDAGPTQQEKYIKSTLEVAKKRAEHRLMTGNFASQ